VVFWSCCAGAEGVVSLSRMTVARQDCWHKCTWPIPELTSAANHHSTALSAGCGWVCRSSRVGTRASRRCVNGRGLDGATIPSSVAVICTTQQYDLDPHVLRAVSLGAAL
jgi:hypothetical protein